MLKVTFEPTALLPGNTLSVEVCGIENATRITNVSVNLVRFDKDDSEWVFGWGAIPSVRNNVITTSTAHTSDLESGIHELVSIKVSYEEAIPRAEVTFIPDRDYERVFLDVPTTGLEGRNQETLRSEVMQIEQAREAEFRKGLEVEPVGQIPNEYKAVALLAPCLITRHMRLGQTELIPFGGLPSLEYEYFIKNFFQVSENRPDLSDFMNKVERDSASQNPAALLHFPLIRTASKDNAISFVLARCSLINDILSIHRDSYGRTICFLLLDLKTQQSWYYPQIQHYRGNILGGPISGESPGLLREHLAQVLPDSSLQLFLSLYRQGLTEVNVDFGYFRYWNLLEAMAVYYIPEGIGVTDFQNVPVVWRNKPAKTNSGIGRVYHLIKMHFQSGQIAENPFSSSLPNPRRSLWELCQIWYAYRNATAHYGGFDPSNPVQQRQRWYHMAISAYNEILTAKTTRNIQTDSYYEALKETAKIVLRRQITPGPAP